FRTASMGCCPIVPLLASDHVVGRPVFDQADRKLGTIKRLVIEKSSGGINYVEVDRHVLLGLFVKEDHIPWHSLAFVERLNGYRFSGTTLP
ncbi:MAG: hypothetical protein JWL62_8, partial [Hyphomicrobiales bacterium]|nr:hypothetical protein [Hyphomicrobiales bacterium]